MFSLSFKSWSHENTENYEDETRSQVSGAYLGRQAKLDMNQIARTWYQNKKQGFAPAVVNAESATTEQQSSANEGAIKTHGDCTRWRLCWVQVDEHVMPIALYQLEGYCLTSPAPLRAEVPATASVFPIVETAKEIVTSVEQLQQCYSSTVEPKVSVSAALCALGKRAQHRRPVEQRRCCASAAGCSLQRPLWCGDGVGQGVLGILGPQVEGPDWKRKTVSV